MPKRLVRWAADRELFFVAALWPFFLFPGDYTLAGLAIIVGLWLCRWWARGRVAARLPVIDASILVLLLMLPVGLWASVDLALSWPVLYRLVWGVALFYAVVHTVQSERQARWVAYGLFAVAAVMSLIGLVGTNWTRTKLIALPVYDYLPALITDQSAFPGGALHPNIVAGALVPWVPMMLSLAVVVEDGRRRQAGRRITLAFLAALLSFTIFLTQSRGGWLGLGAGVLAFAVLADRRLRLVGLACALVAVVLAIALGGARLRAAFLGLDTTGSGTSRLEVWNRALYMIRDMPFTGIGLGTFPVILDAFYPSFLAGPDARVPHAHNLFLQVAVDLGVPGALAFGALFVTCLFWAVRACRRSERRSFLWGLSAGMVAALVSIFVHGLFDVSLWAARPAPLLWVLLGLTPPVCALATVNCAASPAREQTAVQRTEVWLLLAACLTGNWTAADGGTPDWEAVVALAERLGLGPLLFRTLKRAGVDLPSELKAKLSNAYWITLGKNLRYEKRLADVVRVFQHGGIPCVVLKGLALAHVAYPDLGTRGMGDVDLLVKEHDVKRASSLLGDLGYKLLAEAGHPGDFVSRFDGERAFQQPDAFGCLIELHWRLVNYDWSRATARIEMDDLWSRARPLALEDVTALQLTLVDTLLHLCVHMAIHHDYRGIGQFVDLDRLVRRNPGLDWEAVIERARGFRLRGVVYFSLLFTRQLFDTPIPDEVLRQLVPPLLVRWAVGQLVDPLGPVLGERARLGTQSERLLHFLLVDCWQDRLRGLVRVFFPGRDWIAARYSAERPYRVALCTALHPLRMVWLVALAFDQLVSYGRGG